MISKIELKTIPFNSTMRSLDALKTFNYFFGANGSGKTTISRIIAQPEDYASCGIAWENGTQLETRVYNRDFLERTYKPQLKGVFTLGETEADTLEQIEKTKGDITKIKSDIEGLTKTLQGENGSGGKQKELADLTATNKAKFWKQKQKHGAKLGGGLTGYLGDSTKFLQKVLSESSDNQSILLSQSELEEKSATIFSNTLTFAESLPTINTSGIIALEKNRILQKCIIGKGDVDIAAMIKKLGNSDWARQGLSFYEANDGVCPFCQQRTTQDFEKSLKEYFDETFAQDSSAVNKLVSDYSTEAQRLQQQIQDLINNQSRFLDTEKLKTEKQLLDSLISGNILHLKEKQKEMSKSISLDSLENALSSITTLIITANKNVEEHNDIIKNIRTEKETLTSQIWRFVVEELSSDITEYNNKKKGLDNAIANLMKQIAEKNADKWSNEHKLSELEKQSTTIIPTRDGINALLSSFGFKSFKLELGDDKRTYKLVRQNGTDAHQTLSEGERNFVTFLYFYYLLTGSQEESGLANDKVVVFDDPVSSLDNEILFIVSSLIRELFDDVRKSRGTIKQVFVLTHNVYFHKEVTYSCKRNKDKLLNEESFWLIKKHGIDSVVEPQTSNPIKTLYELLWEEVRSDQRNNATIQNTLRRILENYFKLLGDIPLDTLYTKFDGDSKIKCKTLCSWINDGSHSVFDDDQYTSLDDATVGKYLEVFKQIFEQCGHIAHYNMMMGTTHSSDELQRWH